jgi:hypothetical protein
MKFKFSCCAEISKALSINNLYISMAALLRLWPLTIRPKPERLARKTYRLFLNKP